MIYLLIILGVLLLIPAFSILVPRPSLWLMAKLNPRVTFFAKTPEKVIALSVDDGPTDEITPGILDRLAEHDAHATFFVLGERVAGHEDLLDRMLHEGHELANHLWEDRPSIGLSSEEFATRLARVDTLLANHADPRLFRPGSGWFHRPILDELERQGYRCVLASNAPLDTKTQNVKLITDYMLRSVFPGAILVLHDGPGREHNLRVLDELLPALRKRGYRVVTVSELLALDAPPKRP
jgi:peptidoglycan/xylan/chitin deacetylase (PgdA/CDA1 family)